MFILSYGVLAPGLADLTVSNCVFSGNTAIYGGGMYLDSFNRAITRPTVINCVFENNSATETGGGIYTEAVFLSGCYPEFKNCTI